MRGLLSNILTFAAVGTASVAAAQEGDVEAGRLLAEDFCIRCHDVTPDGAFKQYPPSFAAIAVYRDDAQIRQRIMFPPMHASMPEMWEFLMPENVVDVTAYIRSLEDTD